MINEREHFRLITFSFSLCDKIGIFFFLNILWNYLLKTLNYKFEYSNIKR